MFSKKPTEGKIKHKEDNFDSFSYQCLDDLICSDKKDAIVVDNIDDLVDSVLAKSKVTSYERHVKDIKRIRPFDKKQSVKKPKSCGGAGPIFGISDSMSVKKLFSIVLSFVLLFAVLASASSFVDPDLDGATVNPEDMLVEDTLSSNATIPNTNHTDDTVDDEPHLDDGTLMEENESLNETTPPIDIDDENMTGNETIISTGLNLSLQSDKDVYLVNETVSIDGTVSYNNSLINTSVSLLIVGPGYNLSVSLNTSDGRFDYQFIPVVVGNYSVQALASFENETVQKEIVFYVYTKQEDDEYEEPEPSPEKVEPYIYFTAPENSFGVKETKTVNLSYFWSLFRRHNSWQMEGWHPVQEQWVTEFQGTNLNEYLNITKIVIEDEGEGERNNYEKITLNFTSPYTTRYRFKFGIDARVKNYINKSSDYEYVLIYPANETEDYIVYFNWSDVKPLIQSGTISVRHGIKEIQGNDAFWFMITGNQILSEGNSFEIDPAFGHSSPFGSTGTSSADRTKGSIASPTSDGIADSISLRVGTGWAAGEEIKCGLYIQNGANDYTFVAGTEELTTGGSGWFVFDFQDPKPTVYAANNYAVVFFADDAFQYYYQGGTGAENTQTYPTWGANLNDYAYEYNLYCTYTEFSSPTVITNASTGVEEINATLHGYLQNNGLADSTCYLLLNDTNDFDSPIFNLSKGVVANNSDFSNDTAGEATLTQGKLYYFDTKANNSEGWNESGGVQMFLTKPDNISAFTATLYGTTQINLTWANEAGGDGAYIEYAKNAPPSPWNEGDGTPIDADGNVTSPFAHSSLDGGTRYYYKAWAYATDGSWTSSGNQSAPRGDAMTADETTTGSPSVVTNDTTGIEETNATLEGWLQSNGTLDTTCYFLLNDTNDFGSPIFNLSKGVIANGDGFENDTAGEATLIKGMLYYVDTKANNSGGWNESGGVKAFLTKPDPPTSLMLQTNSSSVIYLTWSTGNGYNITYIERNASGDTVWARGDGTMVYNDSGTNYEDAGLVSGTAYYYQAWSFANWTYNPTLFQFSDENASANSTTNNPPTQSGESPTNDSSGISLEPYMYVICSDSDGDTLNATWWSNSSGSWVQFGSNETSFASGTNISQNNSNFSGYSVTYWWSVNLTDGEGDWSNETYHFTTELIDTSVDTISPYNITSSPFTINASGQTDLGNVTLWYRYSSDNYTSLVSYETGVEENVNGWTVVNLNNNYSNPVVIVTGQEGGDISLDIEKSRPMIRNVDSDSFEVRVMNDTGAIITEDVGYIVMEEGHWEIDGVEVETGTYSVPDAASHAITFAESFPGNTVVVDTIQEETSVPGSSRYTENSMTSTGYTVYWEGYDDNSNLATVTAGYIAVELGSSSSIFESGIADEVADDPDSGTWSSVSFSNSYSVTPILFTNPIDTGGGDPTIVGRSNLDTTGVDVRCTEGQNQDAELAHATNDIPWIVWTETTANFTNWTVWSGASNPDTATPWGWDFDFSNGTGYYEFYSIGNKSGSTNETAPSSADAICNYVPPTVPIVTTNASTGVEETNATLNGWLQDNGGVDTTCGFRFGTSSGSYSENYSVGTITDATEFSNNNGSLTQGQIYYYQAWANNSVGFANGTELTFLTKPEAPSGLTAQTNGTSVIYLTWTSGAGYNTTYVERNASGDTVWARGDGTMIYNGSGTNYEDTSLAEGITYYYQAWNYANWTYDSTTLYQWSDVNDSAGNITHDRPSIDLVNPSPNGTTGVSTLPMCQIWANDSDSSTLDVYWYENSTGSYILRNTNSSISANNTVSYTFTGFSNYSTTYYWKVAVNDSTYNTTEWYYFTTQIINTSVNTISPYIITYSPYELTVSGYSDLDKVILWYQFSTDNSSWSGWMENETDTVYPWNWSFTFSNGTGYYEFYSIGNKSGSPNETAPGSADAICHYNVSVNNAPTQSNKVPANQSTGISLTPQLNVTVDDGDLDTLNATWWSNSSGSWVQFGSNLSIDTSSGSVNIIQTNSNFSNYSQTYWWSVNLTDETDWTNETYYFTTESINTSVDTITPYNITSSPLALTATGDSDLGNVSLYYRWSDNNWSDYEGYGIFNGSESTLGRDFNDPTYRALEWNNQSYDDEYFSYNAANPTYITCDVAGDYLIALSLPIYDLTQSGADNNRMCIEAAVYVDGTRIEVGTARNSYLRGEAGALDHFKSSNNFVVLVPSVSQGSDIEIYVRGSGDTTETVGTENNYALYTEFIDSSETIFFANATTTTASASNTNLNQGTENTFNEEMQWTEIIKDTGFTHDDGSDEHNITIDDAGYYYVSVNIPLGGAITRGNVGGAVQLDGTTVDGGTFLQGYIRNNAEGNTDSSIHWAGLVKTNNNNENLTISVGRWAAAGTMTTDGLNATIFVRKLADNTRIFQANATQVSGESADDWNPDTTEYPLWNAAMEKDTNYYYHGDGSQNITVLQDGLYLLSFNSPRLTTTGQREAPQFTIYVNDEAQDGSRTGSSYIRDSGDADESSTVLTYALNLSANDDIEIGVVRGDSTTTVSVDDQDEGVIFIEYKGEIGGNEGTWIKWSDASNPDTSSPWSWDFDFPNGTGYYEFYSIGNKSGSPNETAPVSADAICRLIENTTIEITPSQWDIGTTTIGSNNYSTSNYYFNLTNNGTVILNIQIKASNATNATTGAQWELSSTPAFDNYSLQYNRSGDVSWTNINLTYDTFVANLATSSWQTFDLNAFMATTSSKEDPLSITVTFRSVAS